MIRKGEPWGATVTIRGDEPVATSDAELARLLGPDVVVLRGGDLFASLGGRPSPEPLALPIDAIAVTLGGKAGDDGDGSTYTAVAHVVARAGGWRGPFAVAMNGTQLGPWNLGPKAHPNDGLIDVKDSDLRIDTFRSSGAGGQHVNKTESAIRITHLPTGLVVSCQDEKSQHKNKAKGLKVLRSRLFDLKQQEQQQQIAQERKSQVGTGDRSERIRTYNFPQGRITDHRIGLTLYRLEAMLDGDLDELLQGLIAYHRTRALAQA